MFLLALYLKYSSFYISKPDTIYKYFETKKNPQVSRFQIFLRETFYLKNSKIGRKKEARRIDKIRIEFHFELDILL